MTRRTKALRVSRRTRLARPARSAIVGQGAPLSMPVWSRADTTSTLFPPGVQEAIDLLYSSREVALFTLFDWPRVDDPTPVRASTDGGEPLLERVQALERRLLDALYLFARQHEEIDTDAADANGTDDLDELRGQTRATLNAVSNLWRLVPELRE